MNLIPAGTFIMGSNEQFVLSAVRWCEESGSNDPCLRSEYENELPYHEVTLDAFYMDVTEVTNAHYRVCVEAGDCTPPADRRFFDDPQYEDYPVVFVTWHDARKYCEAMDERLPTEAQWERAATGQGWIAFPWGEAWDPTLANTEEQGGNSLQPVGQYPGGASPFGILDMSGNAWEWVADWYDPQYYQSSPQHNPLGPPAGSDKVLRGGGFSSHFYYARTTNRGFAPPDSSSIYRGFRCVLPVDG